MAIVHLNRSHHARQQLPFHRLLDMGNATTPPASQVAVGLAKAFGCGVNDLPLTIVLSWFEQKAVAVLLALPGASDHPGVQQTHVDSDRLHHPALRQVVLAVVPIFMDQGR